MTSHRGKVFYQNELAGYIEQAEGEYVFQYTPEYISAANARPISLTLPLQSEAYRSPILFPFFDGLIPEGWLLNIAVENWKLHAKDRMSLLLALCHDCIGAVHVLPITKAGAS